MNIFLKLFLLITTLAFSTETEPLGEGINSLEILTGGPNSLVNGCVNVLTGDYIDVQKDLEIAGSEPFTLERFYCSSQTSFPSPLKAWRLNHDMAIKTIDSSRHINALLHDALGARMLFIGKAFPHKKTRHYHLDPALFEKKITHTELTGKTYLKNRSVHLTEEGDYYLKDGAGGSMIFDAHQQLTIYYKNSQDRLIKIELPNGSTKKFTWSDRGNLLSKTLESDLNHKDHAPHLGLYWTRLF